LEINESRLYCEVHHFEFVTQIGPKFEGLKRDSSIWIEDDDNDKNELASPSCRYKESKQAKSAGKGFEEPTTCQLATPPSHIEPISPPSPATLTSDNSTIETTSSSNEKKSHHEGNHRGVALKPLYFSFIVSKEGGNERFINLR